MADFSQWWWQAAGVDPGPGPGPDAGDPIGQSLRFRGAQSLTKTFGTTSNIWTSSIWFKRALLGAGTGTGPQQLMMMDGGGTQQRLQSDDTLLFGSSAITTTVFRDASAWGHLVCSCDGSTSEAWFNGQKITTFSPAPGPLNSGGSVEIGKFSTTAFEGYMAAVYFIDGQALDPTTFGRFNSQGVWVPVDAQGLTYGTNGFKLTFEDPSNIGKDYSPNSNDFQATGFDFNPVGIFSDYLFSSTTPLNINSIDKNIGLSSGSVASKSFDGSTSSWAISKTAADNWFIFRPSTPLTGVTSIQFTATTNAFTININGTNTGQTVTPTSSTAITDITLPGGFNGTLNSIAFNNTDSGSGQNCFSQLIINGVTLVDNSDGSDYDLMQDSPTQNWATLNPLVPQYNVISNANLSLTAQSNVDQYFTAITQRVDSPAYGEFTEVQGGSSYPAFGLCNAYKASNLLQGFDFSGEGINTDPNSAYIAGNGWTYRRGVATQQPGQPTWALGDVVRWRFDPTTGVCSIAVNSGAWFDWLTLTPEELQEEDFKYFVAANGNVAGTAEGAYNFGQQPFQYTTPAGFEALQTQNMPTPEILDGREHFQAITGSGQGADGTVVPGQRPGSWSAYLTTDGTWGSDGPGQAFTGQANGSTSAKLAGGSTANVTFEPPAFTFTDKVEIWTNSNARVYFNDSPNPAVTGNNSFQVIASGGGTLSKIFYEHNSQAIHVNAIKVDGEILTDLNILAIAQSTFPNGLWWIKDRANSNAHQFVDSVRGGNLALQCPGNGQDTGYIAPAGSSIAWCWNAGETPVTNGNGTISAQVSANVGAGFSVVTYTGNGVVSTVGHGLSQPLDLMIVKSRTGSDNWRIYLSALGSGQYMSLNSSSAAVSGTPIWNNTDPTDQVFTVGAGQQVNNSNDYVAYCWHSVPGYSSFGSYQGNGSDDGPFIYTGHSVAWLLFKSADSSQYWGIYDVARDTYNPMTHALYPNLANAESADVNIDFLSNGFKIRDSRGFVNKAETYIYAAFASCPFQSPATAR